MPANACSLVWRGTLWFEGCVLPSPLWDDVGVCAQSEKQKFTCDYVRYLAPPRLRGQQWFVRRFDRELYENSRIDRILFYEENANVVLCFSVSVKRSHHGGRRVLRSVLCGYLVLGLASGLEAFSREPPCDSIGALAVRQTPETSGMAREFLSYYPLLPSRYLRDPSTISINRKFWNSLSTMIWTTLPSTRRRRMPKNSTQFASRENLSQFPAK